MHTPPKMKHHDTWDAIKTSLLLSTKKNLQKSSSFAFPVCLCLYSRFLPSVPTTSSSSSSSSSSSLLSLLSSSSSSNKNLPNVCFHPFRPCTSSTQRVPPRNSRVPCAQPHHLHHASLIRYQDWGGPQSSCVEFFVYEWWFMYRGLSNHLWSM